MAEGLISVAWDGAVTGSVAGDLLDEEDRGAEVGAAENTLSAYARDLTLFYAFYCFSAFSLGLYVFPSISFMADMTVEGQESKYLGLPSSSRISFGLSGCAACV